LTLAETNREIYERVRQRYHVVVEEYAGKDSDEKSTARLSMNAAFQ